MSQQTEQRGDRVGEDCTVPKKRSVGVRFDAETFEEIAVIVRGERSSISEVVRRLCQVGLAARKQ